MFGDDDGNDEAGTDDGNDGTNTDSTESSLLSFAAVGSLVDITATGKSHRGGHDRNTDAHDYDLFVVLLVTSTDETSPCLHRVPKYHTGRVSFRSHFFSFG